ncbi:MAG: PA2169 family four-helix-bundle protein [Bacteroidota bacterium]
MEKNEALNEVLNDLVKINNDRIAGYERAISEAKDLDIDLKALFEGMIRQSTQYKEELCKVITDDNGMVEDDTTSAGKIYRAWMDIKSTFTDTDRLSILTACEFGEDAAKRSYEAALTANELRDEAARTIVAAQQAGLQKSHDMVKTQRDTYKAMRK